MSLKARSRFESRWSESGRGLPTTGQALARRALNTKDPNRYYHYLGVHPWASREEITKAYRRLAKRCHPDSPSPDAEEFRRLTTIYQVLSDEDVREEYNSTPEGHLYVDDLVKEFSERSPDVVISQSESETPTEKGDHYDYSSIGREEGDCEEAQEWYRLLLLAMKHTPFKKPFKVCLIDPEDSMGYIDRPPTFRVYRGLDQKTKISVAWTLGQVASFTCF